MSTPGHLFYWRTNLYRQGMLFPCIREHMLAPTQAQRLKYQDWLHIHGKAFTRVPRRLAFLIDLYQVSVSKTQSRRLITVTGTPQCSRVDWKDLVSQQSRDPIIWPQNPIIWHFWARVYSTSLGGPFIMWIIKFRKLDFWKQGMASKWLVFWSLICYFCSKRWDNFFFCLAGWEGY